RDIRATTKRLEKLALLERYSPSLDDASLAIAARFFSGTIFPRHDMRTVMIGGRSVWDALASIADTDAGALVDRYQRHGDTGDLAAELLEGRAESGISLVSIESRLAEIAATSGSLARRALVREL